MSRTRTNLVRIVAAAMLALSACLVAWWPQSAAGSDDGAYFPVAAKPTQKTPSETTPTVTVSPTRTPTVTVAPTSAAPTPPAAPSASPTRQPTKKPNPAGSNHGGKGGKKPPVLHNNQGGGAQQGAGSASSGHQAPAAVAPAAPVGSTVVGPASPSARAATTAPPATAAPAGPSTTTPAAGPGDRTAEAEPTAASTDDGSGVAPTYDTYAGSADPVQSKSAPVWVVPGILLILTSMLALLGGLLGRGSGTPDRS